ncbi:sensor histidine kinase [Dermatobacter hominis]|uniref:sensor histidine kinase n=1 Tax=Dermatobacter hominis TaxID=2884263 RepID=UPI001D110E0A|nr:HAMP domain-containing sensor histidine kinase [Dermatobacter hominis]UDY34926.1 HAMP domain-containing histidine kinase [Dermatobacter hominis]
MTVPPVTATVTDTATLALLTLAGAVPVALLGVWLGRRSSSSVRRQALIVALVPLAATWVGALLAARAMFLSAHDMGAFVTIALTAAVVGVGAAWELGRRIRTDARRLEELSQEIADGAVPTGPPGASVSELGRVGDQLAEMSQRLDRSHRRELALERSRRELVAWVSHDLRSPLAGIRAMAEALEDGVVDDPDDVQRYLRTIGAETDRLAALVDDLFELSRITSGTVDLTPRSVRVDELVGSVIEAAGATARARSLDLECDLGDPAPLLVSPAEASRVLRNLLDNALRHTPPGGTVRVTVAEHGRNAVISVVDECGGIPAQDLDRVFDVAFRGDAARTRDTGGGGLGLAIAKGLAEAQDGRIDVANHVGGCCFTVRFPLAQPGPA